MIIVHGFEVVGRDVQIAMEHIDCEDWNEYVYWGIVQKLCLAGF